MAKANKAKAMATVNSTMSTRYGGETVSAADKKENKDIDKIMTKYLSRTKGGFTIPNGLEERPNYELIE